MEFKCSKVFALRWKGKTKKIKTETTNTLVAECVLRKKVNERI